MTRSRCGRQTLRQAAAAATGGSGSSSSRSKQQQAKQQRRRQPRAGGASTGLLGTVLQQGRLPPAAAQGACRRRQPAAPAAVQQSKHAPAAAATHASRIISLLAAPCSLPLHVQVYGYAIYKNGKYAAVKYPMEGYSEDVAGRSFHHGRFVQRLRQRAAAQPSVTCREATVRRLINGERRRSSRRRLQQQQQQALSCVRCTACAPQHAPRSSSLAHPCCCSCAPALHPPQPSATPLRPQTAARTGTRASPFRACSTRAATAWCGRRPHT